MLKWLKSLRNVIISSLLVPEIWNIPLRSARVFWEIRFFEKKTTLNTLNTLKA